MSSFRPHLRRFALLAATVALIGGALAVPINAVDASVTGSLSYDEQVTLTPEAVAIVTIVDQTAAADAGVVIGQQRIDAPAAIPIDFSVLFDADTIDQTHSYALFATIVDGTTTWQNAVGEPVITGGPIEGRGPGPDRPPEPGRRSSAGRSCLRPARSSAPSAVAIAALIKVETGTLVARQTRPVVDPADLTFSIGYDPALLDPAATYVVKGGIVDGAVRLPEPRGRDGDRGRKGHRDRRASGDAGADGRAGRIGPAFAASDPDRHTDRGRHADRDRDIGCER